jgi:hypothetical protein
MRPSTLHIPTEPNRVKIYGVTEKSTRNGWQGTVLLWVWSVHESKSHTKWATPRAPLPDSHGLGEIRSTVCHVITRCPGAGRGPPLPHAYRGLTLTAASACPPAYPGAPPPELCQAIRVPCRGTSSLSRSARVVDSPWSPGPLRAVLAS